MRELSLHVLDIVENALEAGATRVCIEIDEDSRRNRLTIRVSDNGRGMSAETLQRLADPFYTTRTTRPVGLGIPLLRAAARRCNGDLTITSQVGQGTEVTAEFERDHIDRAPLGDIKSTLLGTILSHKTCDVQYRHHVDERLFAFDTEEMRRELGEVPLTHPRVRAWLEEFLTEGLAELCQPRS
ncbi:MAG: ATP-binding protein [Anaerolineae bacterium]